MDSKTETGAIQDEPGTLVVQTVRKFWGKKKSNHNDRNMSKKHWSFQGSKLKQFKQKI